MRSVSLKCKQDDTLKEPKKDNLELVYTNIQGPILVINFGRFMIFTMFIDDYKKRIWHCFMSHESEMFYASRFRMIMLRWHQNSCQVFPF